MNMYRVAIVVLVFGLAPVCSLAQPQSEIDSLLNRASSALDHYQRIAPGFHCENVQKPEFRNACTAATETLAERVEEAKSEIALYRRRPNPQPADLFDAYENFGRVLAIVEDVIYVDPDAYGEHNKQLFTEAYNSFVKVNAWFGGVVKASMQVNARCPGR